MTGQVPQDRHAVKVRGLSWSADGTNILARHGEALGLVGPNGAGKTTLLKQVRFI